MSMKTLGIIAGALGAVGALSYLSSMSSSSLAEYFDHKDGCDCNRCDLQAKIDGRRLTREDLDRMEAINDPFKLPEDLRTDLWSQLLESTSYNPMYFRDMEELRRAAASIGNRVPRTAGEMEEYVMRRIMQAQGRRPAYAETDGDEAMLGAELQRMLRHPQARNVFVRKMREKMGPSFRDRRADEGDAMIAKLFPNRVQLREFEAGPSWPLEASRYNVYLGMKSGEPCPRCGRPLLTVRGGKDGGCDCRSRDRGI